MMCEIPKDSKDCIGRHFALDGGRDPGEAVANAYKKVQEGAFMS
jgi:hypothetical protein